MELKGVNLNLIKKRLEGIKDKNGKEKAEELLIILRMLYPLVADSKGSEVLELYTKLKKGEGTDEAESFIRETINSL
ncbi:hypothetical protein JCM9492_10390 [Aquifex pyrophilus]